MRRTYIESVGDETGASAALRALAEEAADAGLGSWLRAGVSTRGTCRASRSAEPKPTTPAEHYLAAQRLLARQGKAQGQADAGADPRAGAAGGRAVARHPGADAALALAEKLVGRVASGESEPSRRRLDLLRAAHGDEYEPARRARLGWRLAAQLEAVGDVDRRGRRAGTRARGIGARRRGARARRTRAPAAAALGTPARARSGAGEGRRRAARATRACPCWPSRPGCWRRRARRSARSTCA